MPQPAASNSNPDYNHDSEFLYNPLWAGAMIGWKQALKEDPELNDIVDIKSLDDQHSPKEAENVAKQIRNNPSTLAVIGHDQSNTTFAAEPIYADSGIPIVFPAATSTEVGKRYPRRAIVMKSHQSVQASNFVRLPPPDVPYQTHALRVAAFAIADYKGLASGADIGVQKPVSKRRSPKVPIRIYLVRETSRNADVYSGPMADDLQNNDRFSRLVVGERQFDRDQLDVYTLVTSIRGTRADLVVFIGYPESALDLLQEMKERVHQERSTGPAFLFTDACYTSDLADGGFPFDVYVTSSTLDLNDCEPPKESSEAFESLAQLNHHVTSEVYAADAILLLSRAINYCHQSPETLGRRCVMSYIRRQRDFYGVCRPYHIDEGESRNGLYLLYAHKQGNKSGFLPQGFIRADYEHLLADTRLP